MKRIPFFIAAALLFLSIAWFYALDQAVAKGKECRPDHITLTWTGNPATTMTITWCAHSSTTSGCVRYQQGESLTESADCVRASNYKFSTDTGQSMLFTANLTNLMPAAKYTYRVGDGVEWSKTRTFTTADPNVTGFKFLVFGDSQSVASGKSPYGVWRRTLQNAFKANPDAKFFVNVGDLVDVGQSGAHWNAWFAACEGVIDTIPAMPVLGNHEYSGSGNARIPVYWNAQFKLPRNGPSGLKNQVYSYDYGPVHIVVLDSQQGGNGLAVQRKWLDSDLAASKAKWKIAFFHRPPYSIKSGRSNDDIKRAFCPVLEKHNVVAVFSAHDHGIARTYPLRNGAKAANPSQGTTYYISGRSGTKTYRDLSKRSYDAFFYNPLNQPNYFIVQVTSSSLEIKTVNADGTALDTYRL